MSPAADSDDRAGPAIEELLAQVQTALLEVGRRVPPELPPLAHVILRLQGAFTSKGSGRIKLFFPFYGLEVEREKLHEVVLKLEPPRSTLAPDEAPQISVSLVEAINDAVEGVRKARTAEPPLVLDELKVAISFTAMATSRAGVSFALKAVEVDLEGSVRNKAVHAIELFFQRL